MAIVINTANFEQSTDDVLDWLYYFGKSSLRLNDDFHFNDIAISINDDNAAFDLATSNISFTDAGIFWYRRGGISLLKPDAFPINELGASSAKYYQKEMGYVLDTVYGIGRAKNKYLNKQSDNYTNKVSNLFAAKRAGMKIPDTLVTNVVGKIKEFISKHNDIIIKPIAYPLFNVYQPTTDDFCSIAVSTIKLTAQEVMQLMSRYDKGFVPTLFQAYIPKRYEIRSFYLEGKFFSMAIFSQMNEKTKDDYRHYDYERPNRTITYQLPEEIEKSLMVFMQSIDMNCGSFDLIVTPEGEHVFLEVNPVGQFQWLSRNCNYFIERHIAQTLCND